MKKLNYLLTLMIVSLLFSCGGGTSETVSNAVEEAEETVENVADDASEAASGVGEAVENATDAVGDGAEAVTDSLKGIGVDGQTYTDAEGRLVYNIAEVKPEFEGGEEALNKYLSKNIKYPASAQRDKNEGRVIVQFVVAEDGSIVDTEVVKAVGDESLNAEALRVIQEMPNWTPGQQGGKPVNVKYTLPVNFKLQ